MVVTEIVYYLAHSRKSLANQLTSCFVQTAIEILSPLAVISSCQSDAEISVSGGKELFIKESDRS